MTDYNNTIFKPRKDSGFVVKFRLTPGKAEEKQKDREQQDEDHITCSNALIS